MTIEELYDYEIEREQDSIEEYTCVSLGIAACLLADKVKNNECMTPKECKAVLDQILEVPDTDETTLSECIINLGNDINPVLHGCFLSSKNPKNHRQNSLFSQWEIPCY